ncbi:MAG: hypothetical protein IRZ08_12140 [Frankia sp.]|nr:hypothetical protein [Frankia sp.]
MGRDLVTPELFGRLAARLAHDHPEVAEAAERIVDQALVFLTTCGANLDVKLRPSPTVDLGWHTFLLFTRDYAAFCEQTAGRFLHHVPDDGPREAPGDVADLGATVALIRRSGFEVDPDLWVVAAQCSQCYQGCHDDPKEI